MEKRSDAIRGVSRHRVVYATIRVTLGWLFNLITGFSYEPYKPKSKTFLFFANHTSDMDPIYEAIGLRKHIRFVASENAMQGPFGKIIAFLVGPIPRRKGASADDTVEAVLENLKNGVSVCIHPEGNRTWEGETGFIPPRTAQLVKDAGVGVITYRIDGGYIKSPRWAKNSRRGKIRGRVINEYTSGEIARMTTDEVYGILCRDLYADAFKEQEKRMQPFKGKNLGEGLEKILFICPQCKAIGAFHSQGDGASCTKCGNSVVYDEFGFFRAEDSFKNVLEWHNWQRKWLAEEIDNLSRQTEEPFSKDFGIRLTKGAEAERTLLLSEGSAAIYGDRIELEGEGKRFSFPYSEISKLGVFRLSSICFTCSGEYYEMYAKDGISGIKYFTIWRILSGRDYL